MDMSWLHHHSGVMYPGDIDSAFSDSGMIEAMENGIAGSIDNGSPANTGKTSRVPNTTQVTSCNNDPEGKEMAGEQVNPLRLPMPSLVTPRSSKGIYGEVTDLKHKEAARQKEIEDIRQTVTGLQKYLETLVPWTNEMSEKMNSILIEVFGPRDSEEEIVQDKP
ncbi:hypothetical protein TWF106_010712 [Orbilia oligospora]|uniref:Uncharacterized protein n=1 Tax=Orbilia oligospora TaxID=2813651 RepID=A0A7C8QGR1_ORBOL|nr:hypothetical protein TWF106_010712 [Orbilia oligospora]